MFVDGMDEMMGVRYRVGCSVMVVWFFVWMRYVGKGFI